MGGAALSAAGRGLRGADGGQRHPDRWRERDRHGGRHRRLSGRERRASSRADDLQALHPQNRHGGAQGPRRAAPPRVSERSGDQRRLRHRARSSGGGGPVVGRVRPRLLRARPQGAGVREPHREGELRRGQHRGRHLQEGGGHGPLPPAHELLQPFLLRRPLFQGRGRQRHLGLLLRRRGGLRGPLCHGQRGQHPPGRQRPFHGHLGRLVRGGGLRGHGHRA